MINKCQYLIELEIVILFYKICQNLNKAPERNLGTLLDVISVIRLTLDEKEKAKWAAIIIKNEKIEMEKA